MNHDQVGFIPRMQNWFNIEKSINVRHHINRIKDKMQLILPRDTEKALDKHRATSRGKHSARKREPLQPDRASARRPPPPSHVMVNGWRIPETRGRTRCAFSPPPFNGVPGVPARAPGQDSETEAPRLERKKCGKTSPLR